MRRLLSLALLALVAFSIVGLAQVGTQQHPIYMLLPPSTDTTVITPSGEAIAEYLFQTTGLYIVPVVAADYAALAEAFRSADGDVFGIPTSSQYVQIYAATNGGISAHDGRRPQRLHVLLRHDLRPALEGLHVASRI